MSEMVERVAEAIWRSGTDPHDAFYDWNRLGVAGKNDYRQMARDALKAMREPTPAMIDAAFISDANEDCKALICGKPTLRELHQAMIDAALKDDKPAMPSGW